MERLSLASFLANGHPYHLYVYDNVKHIPAGAIVEDANAFLPALDDLQVQECRLVRWILELLSLQAASRARWMVGRY